MATPTHKDLIIQTGTIIASYVTCVVDYKSKDDITITLGEQTTRFDDEKRAGDYILGYAGGLVSGIDLMVKKQKKFFNDNTF